MERKAGLILLAMLVLGGTSAKEIKRDPDTGLIRVLYVGAPFSTQNPYPFFRTDPLLATTPISGNMFGLPDDMVKKAMRLYMPRSKQTLVSKYDVVGLDDSTYTSFPVGAINWMRDGCLIDGLGIFMGGGSEAFGGAHGFASWGDTVLLEVMPVGLTSQYLGYARNIVVQPHDDFASRTPWDEYESHNMFGAYNVVTLRPGANQISELTPTAGGRNDPGWTWWDVGEGRFFASPTGFRGSIGGPNVITSAGLSFIYWKHYPDFVSNMVYFLAGLTPPADLKLLYIARQRFREIDIQRQLTSGMIEFAAKFNADTDRVDAKMDEAEEILARARGFFVDLDLQSSLGEADGVLAALKEAHDLALKARGTALFWTCVTEWLVVTATGLVCGTGIWTLMVRRRFYREVSSTRAKHIQREF